MKESEFQRTPLRSRTQQEASKDETYLPPRGTVHPSERGKWTVRFYLALVWLFVALVAGLTFWGIKNYY
ncbi:hypothetical protein [Paenibacillus ferrarius]|uniref:hypothetical protein n=1 Tax=Paenibacillus ferrarius TaxID=1469647 RepID=UPI003D283DA3